MSFGNQFSFKKGQPFLPNREGKYLSWEDKLEEFKKKQEEEIKKELVKLFPQYQETDFVSGKNLLEKRKLDYEEPNTQKVKKTIKGGGIYFGL